MPTYPHIERYYADKERFILFGGSDSELNIRRAFANCLDLYCREHRNNLSLVDELGAAHGNQPDGTVKDVLRMAHGYWEAKDTHDNLDKEIQNKLNRGYPRDNIIFEDSQTAVLFQNGAEAMRVDMSRPGELHRLIKRFLDYELPQIEEFRKAREQFKDDLPAVLANLRETIEEAEAENPDYQTAAAAFLGLCHKSISFVVTKADVREMLLQHILTKDIFLRVFNEDQFHGENNVAKQLDALESTFFTGNVRREAIARLLTYYGAIGRAADEVADFAEKQQFLKALYEDFYKAYNPEAADRLGVVYTPNEIVDFIIRGADYLLRKHFDRTLADDNVQILDPATGTGTFVTNLMHYLPPDRLEYKYLNEIHANELAILPYYIANLNIEYTYKERTGRYLEFPNLCFVDTLDNMDWQQVGASGAAVPRQVNLELGSISEENWIRIQSQNSRPISVIIGNPPYNDSATLWGDGSENRPYLEIDRRVKDTYVKESSAQKTHQYDMYKRFIRWASDRLLDDGIIGFVSNRSFLDSRQDDGFRKIVAEDFNELWVIDLKGNARTSGERRRREGGNIFEDKIRVGVAIWFLVRRKGINGFKVLYNPVADYADRFDKAEYIDGKPLTDFDFLEICPDSRNNWLNQPKSDFPNLLPLAGRLIMREEIPKEGVVFGLCPNGIKTNRDEWVYDFSFSNLYSKVSLFVDIYNDLLVNRRTDSVPAIKWSSTLDDRFHQSQQISYSENAYLKSLYRPFVMMHHFTHPALNDRLTDYHYRIFGSDLQSHNILICFSGIASSKPFQVLAVDRLFGFDMLEKTRCLSLYRYTALGERVSNITEWGLRQFREAYGDAGISAEDIFAYTYAVLHDPAYREEYAIDLKQEFPRLPLYRDFKAWAAMGQELLDLHIGFEAAAPYPLERVDTGKTAKRVLLRADKVDGRIALDDVTTLRGVPESAWRYRLGSRSALEWVLDQYKERTPRDPTIRERFNTYRFADHKERVIDLLRRVCAVSVRTMEIVDAMAAGQASRERVEWTAPGR